MKSNKEKKLDILLIAGSISIFLLALFVIFSIKGIVKVHKLKGEEQKLQQEIVLIKKSNHTINRQVYELSSNKQFIANLAREKLNMIKKGEIVFKFINSKKKDTDKNGN